MLPADPFPAPLIPALPPFDQAAGGETLKIGLTHEASLQYNKYKS